MKLRHLFAFLAVLISVVAWNATRVWATNAAVTYSQTCDTGKVTVTSTWDGGTIHVHIAGPIPEITLDVPALKQTSATFVIKPNPLKVTVSSSNGHLTGDLTHTFTTGAACTTTTTSNPGVVPGTTVPTFAPPTSIVPFPTSLPPGSSAPVTAPTVKAGVPPAPAAPSTTHPLRALPTTGVDPTTGALVALAVSFLGMALIIVATRRRV